MSGMQNRRDFIAVSAAAMLNPLSVGAATEPRPQTPADPSTTAYEELMSEHSIFRRVLYVYTQAAQLCDTDPVRVPVGSLARAATLFRNVGEDFHENVLEEKHVFPAVTQLAPDVRAMPDILRAQHDAGRAITTYILQTCAKGRIPAASGKQFARTLRDFVWMYQNHAAREDTILFPAWKKMLGNEYQDASREFERLTQQHWGPDGFKDAAQKLAAIEADFGMENLGTFTATVPG